MRRVVEDRKDRKKALKRREPFESGQGYKERYG